MAWLKKKFQGAMEKLEKDDKPKASQLMDGDSYNKLDDVNSVTDLEATSQEGAMTSLINDDDSTDDNGDVDKESDDQQNDLKLSEISDSDRESPKKSRKSESDSDSGKKGKKSDSDKENRKKSPEKKKGKSAEISDSDRETPKKSGNSDSDSESGKKGAKDSEKEPKKKKKLDWEKISGRKSGKSSPETEKKSPEKKKDKVKTHRRVSSASALSALGGFIKKGHKRERSDGAIVIEKFEKLEKAEEKSSETLTEKSSEDLQPPTNDFREKSVLIADTKKERAKEVEKLFRAESPRNMPKSASEHAFRVSSDSPIPIGDEREFTNMSFVIEGEDKPEMTQSQSQPQSLNQQQAFSPNEDFKLRLRDNLKQWQLHSSNVEQMFDLATRMIEKRKADLILAVTEIANDTQSQLQSRYTKETSDAKQAIAKLQEINDNTGNTAWADEQVSFTELPHKPATEPFEMVYDKEKDAKHDLSDIFGAIETKPIQQAFGLNHTSSSKKDKKNTPPPVTKRARKYVHHSDALLLDAEYGGSFSTKTSKDVRECGITDLTFTNSNEIVVVDRHNKLVKVFDYKGTLLRFIGRHSLKQPSRATVLPWNNQILVSDNASQTVNLYHSNGSILSDFATDLKFPIAHCIVGHNQVAIVDFDPKEVAIYTFDQYGGHSKTHSFPILMECPAYITATSDGHLAISDWSCNKVKIFDLEGHVVNQMSKMGAGPGEFKKPQGLAGDCHGNLFVMEQTNHRIQVLSSGGDYIHKYDRSCHEFGVPMCMKTTLDGHFILCEYQGNVKLFKYMDLPNMGLFNYEAPPPRPSVPAPSNAIWPATDNAENQAESMF